MERFPSKSTASPFQSRVPDSPEFEWNVTDSTTLGGDEPFTLSGNSRYGVVTTGAGGGTGVEAFAISEELTGMSMAPVRPEETSRTTRRILRVSAAGIKAM